MVREALALAWMTLAALAVFAASVSAAEARLRDALLRASIAFGVLTVVAVELLSVPEVLAAWPLAVFWGVVTAVATVVAVRRGGPAAIVATLGSLARQRRATPRADRMRLAIAGTFAAVTLLTAVVVPPNNWDAMTYHMPRVAHWLANGSVRHYPVARAQQLFMPPLNAYGIAVLQALAGSDRWANLVQWLAYVGGAAIASLAAHRLGSGRTGQIAAGVAFLTLPMAIAQATTSQADLLTAYWALVLIAIVVGPLRADTALWAGAALGLGLLTKPSFALYALPLVLVLLARAARGPERDGGVASLPAAAVGLTAIALVLQAPHAWRATATFGRPWGGGSEVTRLQNELPGVRSWISNAARDTAVHVPIPGYAAAIARGHAWLGVGPDDPRTTHLPDASFSEVAAQWFRPLIPSEDSVGNPAHFAAAAALLGFVVLRRPALGRAARAALAVAALGVVGWLLMCLPFKWQAWMARFDLPLFAALSIPLGIAVERLRPRTAALMTSCWIVGALPVLMIALHRPLIGVAGVAALAGAPDGSRMPPSVLGASPDDLLFRSNRGWRAPYLAAVDAVRASECDVVGLELERDDWEYPFWRLLGETAGPRARRLRAIGVRNETARLPPEGPDPCLVISSVPESMLSGDPRWEVTKLSADRLFTIYRKRG
jgi:Dolichyl-phosphate-mannose-protein mannosyltransferase